MNTRHLAALFATVTCMACPSPPPTRDAGDAGASIVGDAGGRDAQLPDGGASPDGGTVPDGGRPGVLTDAGNARDAGYADAGGANDVWTSLDDIAAGPRQETGAAVLDGSLYVVGGYDDALTFHNTFLRYDLSTETWTEAPPLPQPMHHPHVVAAAGKLYVLGYLAGGFGAQGGTYVYDPALDVWTSLTWLSPQRQRGGGSAGVIGDTIVVAGGYRSGAVTDVDTYDLSTDTWSEAAPLPEPLDHSFGGVIGESLIVAGGRDTNISALSANTYRYDLAADAWSEGAPMPTPRAGGASAVVGGYLITIGGEGNAAAASGVFDQVEGYDAATDAWLGLSPMPFPRHGMAAGAEGTVIYVPGGADVQAFSAVSTFDALRPALP